MNSDESMAGSAARAVNTTAKRKRDAKAVDRIDMVRRILLPEETGSPDIRDFRMVCSRNQGKQLRQVVPVSILGQPGFFEYAKIALDAAPRANADLNVVLRCNSRARIERGAFSERRADGVEW